MSDVRAHLQSGLGSAYTIERELGGGGMSRVFVARETALNRSVVIKVVASDLLEGMSAERFAREVTLAARLQQANIVPVLAAGDANGLPFYTMPFVRGESLRTWMATSAPISVTDALHILRDIAQALAYAHGEGIVHRDIKPENVLLSGGAAVVTDFGIAKAIDVSRTHDGDQPGTGQAVLTSTGSTLGTPAYMSPEQASCDPRVDHRADIYAWGMIAWELLAGRHPFAAKASLPALVAAQLSEIPEPVASVRGDVPAVLSELVQRCLEKERGRRPASATELLATLDQAASGGSRAAAPAPPAKRRPRVTELGIGILATIVLVALLVIWRLRQDVSSSGIEKSLAIIPFTAPAGDTRSAALGEGISDELTNELKQIGVRLAGSSSAARYMDKSAQEAGKALGFSLVLDGGIVPLGADSVRVRAELTRVSDGELLWQHSYPAARTEIGRVQDEMARAIALQLQVRLADEGGERSRGTKDGVAYELYLQGLYLFSRRGAGIPEAIEAFKEATARDPNFARAWAALSQALTVEPSYEDVRVGAVLPPARAAAEHAIRLAPKLADAHGALGYVHLEAFEWSAAEAELDTAIKLDPTAVEPWYRLGLTLLNQGKPEDAIQAFDSAVALDPLYFMAKSFLGWAELLAGNRSEALKELRESLSYEPNASIPLTLLASSYVRLGMPDSAQAIAGRLLESAPRPLTVRFGYAAYALARSGKADSARALVSKLESLPQDTWMRWTVLAVAYAGLGDSAKMIDAMERAAKTDDGDLFPLGAGTRLIYELPSEPRVDAVLRRYHLDPKRFTKRDGAR